MLENIFYVVAIIGFFLIVVDSTIDFIKGFRKKEEPEAWKKEIDKLEDRIMGKFEIVDLSIENLSTRTQELDEMIRWYAGELKEEELKDWTYIQPDGSVKISSLKEEIRHEPENNNLPSLWDTLKETIKNMPKDTIFLTDDGGVTGIDWAADEERDDKKDNEESQSE